MWLPDARWESGDLMLGRLPTNNIEIDTSTPLGASITSFAPMTIPLKGRANDISDSHSGYVFNESPTWARQDGVHCLRINYDAGGNEGLQASKALIPASEDWTFSMMVYRRFSTIYSYLLSQYVGGQTGRFYLRQRSNTEFQTFDGSNSVYYTIATIPHDQWSQYTFRVKNNVMTVFVNQTKSDSATIASNLYQGINTTVGWGNIGVGERGFIARPIMFNRALEDSEIFEYHKRQYNFLIPS